jgi:DNA-3-methyladenine glycosylase II
MDQKKLAEMNNEEVIKYLTQIKGVGSWQSKCCSCSPLAVKMYLQWMICIQQAMISIYKLDKSDKKLRVDMLRISAKWSPYCSYACLHLWRHKDKSRIANKTYGKQPGSFFPYWFKRWMTEGGRWNKLYSCFPVHSFIY